MIKTYRDQVVVVTGAGNGIGKALAIGCAKRGAKLVVNDIHPEDAQAVTDEIRAMGNEAICVPADVSLTDECQKIFDETMKAFGRCDVLINNAGVSAPGNVTEMPEQDIHWVTETNFYSHWYMMRRFVPQMMAQKSHCQILNVCSIAGLITLSSSPIYFATKHAAVAFSESTYKWLREIEADIDLAVFCPGFVQTEMYLTNRHRPERYPMGDPFYESDIYGQYSAGNKYVLDNGRPLDPVIDEVFEALGKDQFWILTHPQYDKLLREQGVYQADLTRPITMADVADK